MSAVVATKIGPWRESLKLLPSPEVASPGSGLLKIRVLSAGLAFPDVLTVEGKHIMQREAPFVPANECAGEIIEIGSDCEEFGFSVGDIVFGTALDGALQQHTILSAEHAYRLPPGVSVDVAAGFELNYGTTWHGLKDIAQLQRGEKLLVLGASGGVGMAAIDIGVSAGAEVIACASSPAKLEACAAAGATILINYTEGDFKAALKEAGVYGAVDVVYDPVGGQVSEVAMRAMGWGGRFIVIGFAAGGATPKTAIPSFPINLALLNERKIMGCFWGAWKARDGNQGNRENMNEMLRLVASGELKPLISKSYGLHNFADAFDDMMSRRVVGKITIRVNEPSRL